MSASVYKGGWKTIGSSGLSVYKSGWKGIIAGYVYKSGWKQFHVGAPALTAFTATWVSGGSNPCSDPRLYDIDWTPNGAVSDVLHYLQIWFTFSVDAGTYSDGRTKNPATTTSRNGVSSDCGTDGAQNLICNYELRLVSDDSVVASGNEVAGGGKVSLRCA